MYSTGVSFALVRTAAAGTDCVAPTPFCVGGDCEACAENANCPAERPLCHNGACVQCFGRGDQCPAATPVCRDGVCVQ